MVLFAEQQKHDEVTSYSALLIDSILTCVHACTLMNVKDVGYRTGTCFRYGNNSAEW